MILPLCYYDDPILRKKALAIEEISVEIHQLAKDMIKTMIHHNGVGLAAPQVGKLLRIFVIRDEVIAPDGEVSFGKPEVILNPLFTQPSSEKVVMTEGCLSVPNVHTDIIRPSKMHVRYQTLEGQFVEEDLSGFRTRVFLHENDHLNGVLFFDRLTPDKRKKIDSQIQSVKKKYKKK